MDNSNRLQLTERLHKDVHFEELTNNLDRVRYVLDGEMSYEKVRHIIKANVESERKKSAKSLSMANNFKTEAKLFHYQARQMDKNESESIWKRTMDAYAKAILFTPSNELSLLARLYYRKSIAHYEQKEYEAALYSIDMAIEVNSANALCPLKVEYYLKKINCLKNLSRFEQAIELINQLRGDKRVELCNHKLFSDSLHECQASLNKDKSKEIIKPVTSYFSYYIDSRCLIENSKVVGRHFMATEDIPSGVILLEEKPYSTVMESPFWLHKCSNCHTDLGYKFYPCSFCTDLAFCDQKCFLQAYNTFHRFECGMLNLVKDISTPTLHVFRMLSRVGPLQAFQIEKTYSSYSIDDYLAESNQRTVADIEKTREEKGRAYKMSSILWGHNEKHNHLKNVHHTIVAIETAILLDLVHSVRQQRPDTEFLVNFIDVVIVATRRILFNVFGWSDFGPDSTQYQYVASCQCLVGSLINHNCAPNTSWSISDGSVQFTSNRQINKGEEITISYGPLKSMSYFSRQSRLNHYYFACKCKLCFADCSKGVNLRCTACSGPVALNSALNLEPQLNGKCLLCYQKYKNFEEAISQRNAIQESIKSIDSLTLLISDEKLLAKTIELMQKIADLSNPSSTSLVYSMVTCSQIIERLAAQFEMYSLEDKVSLALFINRHLPVEDLPANLIDGKLLSNFKFWLSSLVKYIGQFNLEPTRYNLDEGTMWNGMLAFHCRLLDSLQSLVNDNGDNQMLCKMTIEMEDDWHGLVEQCKAQYGSHLQFKIFRNHCWAKAPTKFRVNSLQL